MTSQDHHALLEAYNDDMRERQEGRMNPRRWARQFGVDIAVAVSELPDRTSPDDWPEAMLVTASELSAIVEARVLPELETAFESGKEEGEDNEKARADQLETMCDAWREQAHHWEGRCRAEMARTDRLAHGADVLIHANACLRRAVEPFAWIGQWMFARPDVPDSEPVTKVVALNNSFDLTREHFKRCHAAVQIAEDGETAHERYTAMFRDTP